MVLGADCFGKVFNMLRENCKKEYYLLLTDYVKLYQPAYKFYYKKVKGAVENTIDYLFIAEMIINEEPIEARVVVSDLEVKMMVGGLEFATECARLGLKEKLIDYLSKRFSIPKSAFFPEPSNTGTGYL